MRDYDILFVFHDEVENQFYDVCGQLVHNIYEIITPNDLFLYRYDSRHNKFNTPFPGVMCKICTMQEGQEYFWDWGYKEYENEPIRFRPN